MKKDKYPRVTQAQLELWIINPVTVCYLQGLDFLNEELKDISCNGSLIDTANNDLSMNKIHSALGEAEGIGKAKEVASILKRYGLIEEAQKKDDEGTTV